MLHNEARKLLIKDYLRTHDAYEVARSFDTYIQIRTIFLMSGHCSPRMFHAYDTSSVSQSATGFNKLQLNSMF